jgi:hypothetical protein
MGLRKHGEGAQAPRAIVLGLFHSHDHGMEALAKALEVSVDEVEQASAMTQRLIKEAQHTAEEQEWRDWCAVFQPHAILRMERSTPSPIFLVALVGVDRILRVDFDSAQPQETWVRQVVARLPKEVIAFGQVTGFFLNFTPDLCIEFDPEGAPLREFARAWRPGRARMEYKGRDITPALRNILGAG